MQKYDFFEVLLQYVFQRSQLFKQKGKYMNLTGIRTQKPHNYSFEPVGYNPVIEALENWLKEQGKSDSFNGNELRMQMQLLMNSEKPDIRVRTRSLTMSIPITLLLLLLVFFYYYIFV